MNRIYSITNKMAPNSEYPGLLDLPVLRGVGRIDAGHDLNHGVLFLWGAALEDLKDLLGLGVRKQLNDHRVWIGLVYFADLLEGSSDDGAAGSDIGGGDVQPLAVVIVPGLPQRAHPWGEDIFDQPEAVAVAVQRAPAGVGCRCGLRNVIEDILGRLEVRFSTIGREGIIIQPQDDVGIEGQHAGEVVIKSVAAELKRLELLVEEGYPLIDVVDQRRFVIGTIHRPGSLYRNISFKGGWRQFFLNGDQDIGADAFFEFEYIFRPLLIIEEFAHRPFQCLKYPWIRRLQLLGVDAHSNVKLLSAKAKGQYRNTQREY